MRYEQEIVARGACPFLYRPGFALMPYAEGFPADLGVSTSSALTGLLNAARDPSPPTVKAKPPATDRLTRVLELLGDRRFTHLSRSGASPYLDAMRPRLAADFDARRPLRFAYDLGPGYHASVHDDFSGLRFTPGLGELLALGQWLALARAVEVFYPAGIRVDLVLDDLCAWVTNDIELSLTAAYRCRLEGLIRELDLSDRVGVLAESALVSVDAYEAAFEAQPQTPVRPRDDVPGQSELDNVRRFLGRNCDPCTALEHLARYTRAQAVSEWVLKPHIQGVRLTQRTSRDCLGFRAFHGSDSRLQTGEVDLLPSPDGSMRPTMITRLNRKRFRRWAVPVSYLPARWPSALGEVCVAVRREFP